MLIQHITFTVLYRTVLHNYPTIPYLSLLYHYLSSLTVQFRHVTKQNSTTPCNYRTSHSSLYFSTTIQHNSSLNRSQQYHYITLLFTTHQCITPTAQGWTLPFNTITSYLHNSTIQYRYSTKQNPTSQKQNYSILYTTIQALHAIIQNISSTPQRITITLQVLLRYGTKHNYTNTPQYIHSTDPHVNNTLQFFTLHLQ